MIGYPQDQVGFAHARRLARRAGVDLVEAVLDGWLRLDELAAFVATCHSCSTGFPCDTLGPTPPAACANATALAALSDTGCSPPTTARVHSPG